MGTNGLGLFLTLLIFSDLAFANAVGSDLQNFNPTSGGVGYVSVQSSNILRPGVYSLGLFTNFAVNPLPEFDAATQSRGGGSAIR